MAAYMNDYDLDHAVSRFIRASCPNRLGAALVVRKLAEWTDENSDGWAYWTKPRQAAKRAMAMIESTTNQADLEQEANDVSDADLTAAIRPIRAFLTRQGVSRQYVDDEILGALRVG